MTKRFLALTLCAVMIICSMGLPVFAAETTYVAKIGETEYTDFSLAMTDAYAATGDVTVEIYGEVEFVNGMELDGGSYTSISFVGMDEDAKIDIQQSAGGDYLTAHGKTVAFTGLKLAKTPAAWANNSGHMGNHFSIQGGTVTYTDCTFLNGACTNTGTAVYNNCTFQNTSEYGLWVYDDALVTVNGGTIDSKKGIKVYSEGEDSVTSTLTVKNATFTENVTDKPAVAIGYAESITLIGNTYNNPLGVLELDSGSDGNCEGIAFVAVDTEGNDITSTLTATDRSNGDAACGVFVTDENGNTSIYTYVTEAAKDAVAGDTVTLLYDTTEEVTFAEGVTLDTNGKTAPEVSVVVAKIGNVGYGSLAEALSAITDDAELTIFAGEYSDVINLTGKKNVKIIADGDVKITAAPVLKGTDWYVEGIDFDYSSGGNILNCNGTLKDCTFTSDGNTVRGAYGTRNGNLVIDGCTFTTGDPKSCWALHFDETYGSDIIIRGSVLNGHLAIGGDVNSMSVEETAFNGGYANTWGSNEEITYTDCTFDVGYIFTGYDESAIVEFTGCSSVDGSSIEDLLYNKDAFVTVDGEVVTRDAKIGNTYYKTLEDAKAAAAPGELVELRNGTFYRAPQAPVGDQVTVVFDFGGGTNADNYISETFVLDLGASITAPTGLTKEGYIFKGWDKTVGATAAANVTYTAQWMLKDDYKFKTVLTPVGGVAVADNEIKIDPQSSFIVEVSIEDVDKSMAWNVTEVTVSYDTKLFKWNKINDTVTEPELGTLVFKVYGEDKVSGKVAKQLSFTAKETATTTETYVGEFKVEKASVDTGWAANTINATLVDEENKGTAKVSIYYTFDVTVGDGVDAPATADTITDYVGKIDKFDPEYNYDVIVDMDGKGEFEVEYDETTGDFVIDNADIVGDFTIDAVKTGIKGVSLDDVEVHEYVAGKYALVLLNAGKNRTYAYNGALMYKTPQYDTIENGKKHYGYLVKEVNFVEENDTLNTAANKALALSKIELASGTNPSIAHIDIIGDVNGTGVVDVNDIQATWNAYNSGSNDAPKVNENMELYFRADVVRDYEVNQTDVNAIITMYDKDIKGVQTVLATCNTNGTTYSIDGIVTAETIPAIGHNYVSAGFEGTGTAMAYVETCTNCGGTSTLPLADIFTTLNVINGQVYGTANVDTAEELIIINKLDAAGKLCHGEGISATININADIDLTGYEWRSMNGHFVTINGNGKTISNITTTQGVSGKGGFISYGGGCRINNLTIENITTEGCQVGAFIGAGEGGSLTNCTLKGNVNLAWKQNYTSDYVEEYGAIGILVGCHTNGGSYTVTINENAIINVDDSDFHTLIDTVGYADTYAPYIQYTMGTSLTYDITDNRNI